MDTNAASLGKEQNFPSTVQWKHHGSPCSRVPRGVEGFGEDKNQNSTSSKLGAFAEPCPFPLVLEMLPDPSGTISPGSFRCFSPTLPLSYLISWQWPCPVLKSLWRSAAMANIQLSKTAASASPRHVLKASCTLFPLT